ncbi:MAG: ExeM/NucH family extracellular endonuclease [Bacteroidales bacterium]|jgi:predicted extracellular nuclease|nr:ExeM/NucH family extracellular endonuclease [Bacteroidales bacterium]
MKQFIFILLFIFSFQLSVLNCQKIYEIQGSSDVSPYNGMSVTTEGVVTAKINYGFFIQDTLGDGNPATSDGIYIYVPNSSTVKPTLASLKVGHYVSLSGMVSEYYGKTEISAMAMTILDSVRLPDFVDFTAEAPVYFADLERFEGMLVRIPQKLVVNDVEYHHNYGQLELSTKRRRAETESFIRKNDEISFYDSLYNDNLNNSLWLDDAAFTASNAFTDATGIVRNGYWAENISGVIDFADGVYYLYPLQNFSFAPDNIRTETPDFQALGNYNYIVSTFNIRQFHNTDTRQTNKIVKAMRAIDADVFGLCEVGQGSPLHVLLDALNAAYGKNEYACIETNLPDNDIYISSAFFYKPAKVSPIGNYNWFNTPYLYRKLYQKFRFSTGDTVFFNINHYKAKGSGGTNGDANQNDGQSGYNAMRVQEAQNSVALLAAEQVAGTKILIMGDLNSLANEEPIRILKEAGYHNQTERFNDNEYSYSYNGKVQYLDYLTANDSLAKHVTGAVAWHINSDESGKWEYNATYQNMPYRCSDHDPVVLGLYFETKASVQISENPNVEIYPNPVVDYFVINCDKGDMSDKFLVEIYDVNGKLHLSQLLHVLPLSQKINVVDLKPGIYFLKIGEYTSKFVKK